MPDSAPDSEEGVLRIAPITVANFTAREEEMALSLTRTPDGTGVLAHAEREGESTIAVFMGWLKILVPSGEDITTAVDGAGMLGLSDQRAFGLLMHGKALGGRCSLDRRGNGEIVIYSCDKSLLNDHRSVDGRRGKIQRVNLLGEVYAAGLDASHRLSASGKFEKTDNHDLLRVVQGWLA